jgi:hypothetical protein
MKVSKFIKVNKDVLVEYIYDDGNLISDVYKVLVNIRDNTYSYVAGETSVTINRPTNQLFKLDPVENTYGIVNTTNYGFLQYRDYAAGAPVRHDTIKVHLPVNYTFGEYLGCYIRVYTYDFSNRTTFDLSNFYFDITDTNQTNILEYTTPPLLIQEKLWGKNITLEIPSVYAVANQRVNGTIKENSINFNLTNGLGLSLNSPIFMEFSFIEGKSTINSVTTYKLTTKTSISVPQSPEFENLSVMVKPSSNGDFFEIYGIYNDSVAEFANFIDNAVQLGNRYNVEYVITMYEQNIRGKTLRIYYTDNFSEKVEFRPIIKYSTTTAIIDVEMRLIDIVDGSEIIRRASYGMLQDEVSKYSLNLMKINLTDASKPKIYNVKSPLGAGIFGRGLTAMSMMSNQNNYGMVGPQLEPVKVPFPVLIDKFNIVSKSDSVRVGKELWYGVGKLQLLIMPFDNILKLIVASQITESQVEYLDLTSASEIKLVMKSQTLTCEFPLYIESGQVDLSIGTLIFRIQASRINDLKKIYDSGNSVFYVTTTSSGITSVIYSGLYKIYDTRQNIEQLNLQQQADEASIISDPDAARGTALVTVREVGATQSVR